jgi:uncharacterized membrane protein YvbJ
MYCSKCGKIIPDNSAFCSECGNVTAANAQQPANFSQNFNGYSQPIIQDTPNTLANIASCCFPVVGLVLYLVWKDTKPQSASSVCKWTVGGLIGGVLIYVLFFIIGMLGAASSY